MRKIRMGVIGLGGISRSHIKGIQKNPDGELVAVCDVIEKSLKDKGDEYGIDESHRFKDHLELLQCADVDAVAICTPNQSHYRIAKDAIKYRKPFLLEKPVAINYQQSLELKNLANQDNIPNMIAFSYRFKAAARYAKWMIGQGYLGRIFHLYAQYFQSWAMNGNIPINWRFLKEYSGSGALADLGSHMIDLARFFVGDFEKVFGHAGTFINQRRIAKDADAYGEVDVDDFCHFMAELEGGIIGNFSITRDAYGRGNYQRVEVYGSKGGLAYTLDANGDYADTIEVFIEGLHDQPGNYHSLSIPQQFKSDQLQSFFDIVNGKGDGKAATIDDGCTCQYILDSILASVKQERWISTKEQD